MTESSTTWYLEPRNPHTNRIISDNLAAEAFIGETSCGDGKLHYLWECPSHSFVAQIKRAREEDSRLDFVEFNRTGPNGQIKPWLFDQPAKRILPSRPESHQRAIRALAHSGRD
jgi:hypothetical protein